MKMKKIIKVGIALIIVSICINLVCAKSVKAAGGITGISFVRRVLNQLSDISSGKTLIKSRGSSILVNGKKIKKSQIKKYMKKYGLTKNEAKTCLAAVELGVITSKDINRLKKKLKILDAASILVRTEEMLYGNDPDTETLKFIISDRIGDIQKIKKEKDRISLAKAYLYGYFKGEAMGRFSHKRVMNPNKAISKKQALSVIKMITDKKLRNELSPDYQVLRKTDLPNNHKFYPYILDSFSNEYYDSGFNGMTSSDFFEKGIGIGSDTLKERMKRKNFAFVYPCEIEGFNSLKYPGAEFSYRSDVFLECNRNSDIISDLAKSSVEFYTYALNVDYRTVRNDKKWNSVMKKYLTENEIKDYIDHCEENKTVIQCDIVSSDPSSVYWYNGNYNCKVYAHFRVVSDLPLQNGYTKGSDQEKYGYLYPVRRGDEVGTLFTRSVLGNLYMDYKIGEWTDFYFNTSGIADEYGCLNCSNTSRGIMIDYSGLCPWLFGLPF